MEDPQTPTAPTLSPPHDSSGHTWHHSDQILLELIRGGSDFPQARMPRSARH